jgi:hypothetical protein
MTLCTPYHLVRTLQRGSKNCSPPELANKDPSVLTSLIPIFLINDNLSFQYRFLTILLAGQNASAALLVYKGACSIIRLLR